MLEALLKNAVAVAKSDRFHDGLRAEGARLDGVSVESAGTYINVSSDCLGSPAAPDAITCMHGLGADLGGHKSQPVSALEINDYDFIICMGDEEVAHVNGLHPRGAVLLTNAGFGGVPNPWKQGLAAYQFCAKILEQVAARFVETYL